MSTSGSPARLDSLFDVQSGAISDGGVTAICTHHEFRADFHRTGRSLPANANDAALLLDQPDDLGLHFQMKGWIAAPLLGQKVQEFPLRHHREKAALSPEVGHIAQHNLVACDPRAGPAPLLVRALEKLL